MSLTNPLGDHVITDPQAMRALAHPVRLAVLARLQQHGPATATQLAPHVGASPSVTSWHLRHLEKHGLVRDWDGGTDRRQRWWQAKARGFRFEMPADEEGASAARLLSNQMLEQNVETLLRWMSDVEPRLDPEGLRISGAANTGLILTADEAERIEQSIEELLAPYVLRRDTDPPADGRSVRMLRYTLVEVDDT